MKYITVIGLGYVGLPAALSAGNSGYVVSGYDTNSKIIEQLRHGRSHLEGIHDREIHELISAKNFTPTTNFDTIKSTDVFVICVPTPLSIDRLPDLSHLLEATKLVASKLKKDNLVIIESTVAPGTVRNVVLPILLKNSGLKIEEFGLAYSPERIDPVNKKWNITNTPKLIASITSLALDSTEKFYQRFINELVRCSSVEVAETAKMLENTFRLVNISLVNEVSIFCNEFNLNIEEVIRVAATKPYGFMAFFPSLGAGGHCIPVDPIYLAQTAENLGIKLEMINLASKINSEMPNYYIEKAKKILNGLSGKKILIIGVAYKPNTSDVRETAVKTLITGLEAQGANVYWHDDLVRQWNGKKSIAISDNYDLAILATAHDYLDLSKLGKIRLIDTRKSTS